MTGDAKESLYLDPTPAPAAANPSGAQNLQEAFGLGPLAASVARTDAHGNKIAANKMNKTYKRQIFDLGLPGPPDIPKNKYIMGLLMAGLAYEKPENVSYEPFTAAELNESFALQPGALHGYVKYRPPSPTAISRKVSKQTTPQPPVVVPKVPIFPGSNSYELVPNRPTTPELPAIPSENGDESSDDGSRFKELERERKKKLRMKREAEALYGDQKRRKYDVDEYSFLDD